MDPDKNEEIEDTNEAPTAWNPRNADKEEEKQRIRDRVRNATVGDNTVFIPAKPEPTIDDDAPMVVAAYARVSTSSTDQVSSIENQTRYYREKIEKNPNWTMHEIYSDEGKSGTSMRKRTEFKRMLQDAKDKKIDLILCASVSRFARNISDCMDQVRILKTENPSHPVGVFFETEHIYTLNEDSQQALEMHAMLAGWESANKSRRMIISYDQRICMGQYPVLDLLGYRHTKDGKLLIEEDEAKTVRFAYLSFLAGDSFEKIAEELTEMGRKTMRGRTDWNASMVANIMTNERRWGDLHARKTVVVDYVRGTTVKNNQRRDAAFVTGHHEGIVSPDIARAAQLIKKSSHGYEGGVSDLLVIGEGALKGFVILSPQWGGIDNHTLTEICASAYNEDEYEKLQHEANVISGIEHSKVASMHYSGYRVPYGAFFINGTTASVTISPRSLKFSKKVHTKLEDCDYIEFLYHPILQTIAIRPCREETPNSFRWKDENGREILNIPAHALCSAIYERMDWITKYRFRLRGVLRQREGSSIMMFYLDEPQILVDKETKARMEAERGYSAVRYIPYRNFEIDLPENDTPDNVIDFGMSLTIRKKRNRLIDSITANDMHIQGTVVENPLIGTIPNKEEILLELSELRQSM